MPRGWDRDEMECCSDCADYDQCEADNNWCDEALAEGTDFEPMYFYEDDDDGFNANRFAQPGSALWAADADNPRIYKCPTCGYPNRLTARDISAGYQCDACADACERGLDIDYYEDGDPEDPCEDCECGECCRDCAYFEGPRVETQDD
jgi:hypothetical protein